ncbi:hypothetical protein JCM10213_002741 [Rhodosporidiobolus nylandii]
MAQQTLNALVGRSVPASDSLADRVAFVKARPSYATNVDGRQFYVDKKEGSPYLRDSATSNPAVFTLAARSHKAFLRKVLSGPPQWSLGLTEPVIDTDYKPGLRCIQRIAQDAVEDGIVDLTLRGGTDVNMQRYYREFEADFPDAQVFPNIRKFLDATDPNDAEPLTDVSCISSYSLVLISFQVKLYDQRKLPAHVQANLPQLQPGYEESVEAEEVVVVEEAEVPAPPVTTPQKRGASRGAKKAAAVDEKKVSADEEPAASSLSSPAKTKGKAKAKSQRYGMRFEMSGIWWMGRDNGEILTGSPTKMPRI